MKKVSLLFLILLFAATCLVASTVPTIDVYTALAPNAFGSPNYAAWQSNAITALENGQTSAGTSDTPAYFSLLGNSPVSASVLEVTSFPSWMGFADPGSVFGPNYANELGERGSFPLVINGNGNKIAIADLSFVAISTDPGNSLGFSFGEGSYNYGPGYVGIDAGPDGILGTADDVYVTSGPNTQSVDEIVGRGSGNAPWPCGPGDSSPCSTVEEQQLDIDQTTSVLAGQEYTGEYSLDISSLNIPDQNSVAGEATINIAAAAPEPSTVLLLSSALGAFAFWRRRRV